MENLNNKKMLVREVDGQYYIFRTIGFIQIERKIFTNN